PQKAPILLTAAKHDRILGHQIAKTEVSDILSRLGLKVTETADGWQVLVPGYRFDISIAEDLIEEVARVYGYNNIPNVAPVAALAMRKFREAELNVQRLRTVLVDRGYQEAITYSFVEPKVQQDRKSEV